MLQQLATAPPANVAMSNVKAESFPWTWRTATPKGQHFPALAALQSQLKSVLFFLECGCLVQRIETREGSYRRVTDTPVHASQASSQLSSHTVT
jgi:hypothetical protein